MVVQNLKVLISTSVHKVLNILCLLYIYPHKESLLLKDVTNIIEMARTLLHEASLPLILWSFACQHVVYIINHLSTSILHSKSPFQMLFGQNPNYNSLKKIGCLCYRWLKPYSKSTLDPRSTPYVYLDFSLIHHCHQCIDLKSFKVYSSRDVGFLKNNFPFIFTSFSYFYYPCVGVSN